jgi:hypothetical protein
MYELHHEGRRQVATRPEQIVCRVNHGGAKNVLEGGRSL